MKMKFTIPLAALILALFSGQSLRFVDSLIVPEEMASYREQFDAQGESLSMQEFERLKKESQKAVRSLEESGFAGKKFLLDFIMAPIFVVITGYIWFVLGRKLSSCSVSYKSLCFLFAAVVLIFAGYSYQPVAHMLALAGGLFFNKINRQFKPLIKSS
jgi:hypothetical protein